LSKRDAAFDERLASTVARRLSQGQPYQALLDELRTRLDEAQAQAILARAAELASPRSGNERPMAVRVPAALAYGWTALLLLQNLAVLTMAGQVLAPDPPASPGAVAALVFGPVAKIGLLCTALLAFRRWRNLYATFFYAAAVLYAFPFGVFVERWLEHMPGPGPAGLVSVSALGSYVAVVMIATAFRHTQRRTPASLAAATFD
jgi:hypothetical protein